MNKQAIRTKFRLGCERFNKTFRFIGVSCHCKHIRNIALEKFEHATFIHPFFDRRIKEKITHSYARSLKGKTCLVLVPVKTDTGWWHEYVLKASEIWFFRGRSTLTSIPKAIALVVFDSKKRRRVPVCRSVTLPAEVKS